MYKLVAPLLRAVWVVTCNAFEISASLQTSLILRFASWLVTVFFFHNILLITNQE